MPTQENNNSDEESINSGDHATSYERHRERNSKKTTTKDVSGVNIGNLSQLIKKKKGADDDDNFDELEKKRKEAQALIKSAELRENLRTGPWILIVRRLWAYIHPSNFVRDAAGNGPFSTTLLASSKMNGDGNSHQNKDGSNHPIDLNISFFQDGTL